jgi:GrpB-like predicted nucleotidyltransferase (UPF0157 family)
MELITLRQHDARWKTLFLQEQECIAAVLEQPASRIHHVGSTAVPDLLAKPIIDIAVESDVFPPAPDIIDKLAAIEYVYKGEASVPGRYWFTKGQPRIFNLHYCAIHSPVVKNQILFRDQLIKNDQLRRAYEYIKRSNYLNKDIDSADYALAKSGFINRVITSSQA